MWDSLKLKEARDRQGKARDEAEETCGEPLVKGPWRNAAELLKALREFL